MDEGRWEQTAWLITHLLQPHAREPDKLDPRKFNPYTIAADAVQRRAEHREKWQALKADFVGGDKT